MRIDAEIEDPSHLVLQKPLGIPVGNKVILEVLTPEASAERDRHVEASAMLLERAYGDQEPDYSSAGAPRASED